MALKKRLGGARDPALLAFDAPAREECTARRARSNTPLAALVMLNDPTQLESARALAELTIESATNDEQRIQWMFRRVLTRNVKQEEKDVLIRFANQRRTEFQSDQSAANKLLAIGNRALPQGIDQTELATWTSVGRVLLNMHETITRF